MFWFIVITVTHKNIKYETVNIHTRETYKQQYIYIHKHINSKYQSYCDDSKTVE